MHGVVAAQNILEKLVIPGPVIQGHVKVEKECDKCHEPFSRQSQTRLCLDCHKETAADRQSRKGFHGLQPNAAKQECRHCHTDHKGREADINQLDRETFDHSFSNYQLKDAHKTVRCEGCHLPKVIFRKAPGRCFDCHKAVDPHKRRLGEKCDSLSYRVEVVTGEALRPRQDQIRARRRPQGRRLRDLSCGRSLQGSRAYLRVVPSPAGRPFRSVWSEMRGVP